MMQEDVDWSAVIVDEALAAEYGMEGDDAAKVAELSRRVQDTNAAILTDPTTLLRFLNAREGDVEAAETMVRGAVRWREEFCVDALMNEWGVTDASGEWRMSPQSKRAEIACRHFYGMRLSMTCEDGAPIMLQRMGKADLNGMVKEQMADLMLNSWVVFLEDALRSGRRESLRQKKLVRAAFLIDVEGVGLSVLRHMGLIVSVSPRGIGSHLALSWHGSLATLSAPGAAVGSHCHLMPLCCCTV